ncbi:TonB [Flavobacteriales bacterium ALC-1]|nr:TonB [Flavobacteriales bacterium ALC-1]
MLHYIIQIIAFQAIFLLVYDLFLKHETFFNCNRLYLLATAIGSIVLPFIKLDMLKGVAPKDFVIQLPEVIIGELSPVTALDAEIALQAGIVLDQASTPLWQVIVMIGVFLSMGVFVFKLLKLYWMKYQNPKRWKGNVLIVKILRSNAAFSFFNTVFLGEHISKNEQQTILKHELIHVEEKHTIDLLFFEVLRVLLWFNPLVYMYQNRIKTLHEYVADAKAIQQNGKKDYYKSLLNQVFETNNISFTNTFFNKSLIKKRIIMLQKTKSRQTKLLKYALIIPIVFGMLFYISCEKEALNNIEKEAVNLEQYAYSMPLKGGMTDAIKETHKIYEDFLKSNPDYVSWGEANPEEGRMNYSIHHKSEQVPEGYDEVGVTSPDGQSYKMYLNFKFFGETAGEVDEVQELNPRDYDNESEVPFKVIDEVPTLAECENLTDNVERKKCFSNTINKFVAKNFNTDLANTLGVNGKQRIFVLFKIDESGSISEIKARAAHPELEDEAKRVIRLLPQFIPGKHNGKAVTVPYSLPIVFNIQP